jgi:hypothetical protein
LFWNQIICSYLFNSFSRRQYLPFILDFCFCLRYICNILSNLVISSTCFPSMLLLLLYFMSTFNIFNCRLECFLRWFLLILALDWSLRLCYWSWSRWNLYRFSSCAFYDSLRLALRYQRILLSWYTKIVFSVIKPMRVVSIIMKILTFVQP